MAKYKMTIRFSDYLETALRYLSKKLDITYNAIVNIALNNYIKRELTDLEQQRIMENIEKVKKLDQNDADDWNRHLVKMTKKQKEIFKNVYQQCLKFQEKNGDFCFMNPKHTKNIKEWDKLTGIEQREIDLRMVSARYKNEPIDMMFKRIENVKKNLDQDKKIMAEYLKKGKRK